MGPICGTPQKSHSQVYKTAANLSKPVATPVVAKEPTFETLSNEVKATWQNLLVKAENEY